MAIIVFLLVNFFLLQMNLMLLMVVFFFIVTLIIYMLSLKCLLVRFFVCFIQVYLFVYFRLFITLNQHRNYSFYLLVTLTLFQKTFLLRLFQYLQIKDLSFNHQQMKTHSILFSIKSYNISHQEFLNQSSSDNLQSLSVQLYVFCPMLESLGLVSNVIMQK